MTRLEDKSKVEPEDIREVNYFQMTQNRFKNIQGRTRHVGTAGTLIYFLCSEERLRLVFLELFKKLDKSCLFMLKFRSLS